MSSAKKTQKSQPLQNQRRNFPLVTKPSASFVLESMKMFPYTFSKMQPSRVSCCSDAEKSLCLPRKKKKKNPTTAHGVSERWQRPQASWSLVIPVLIPGSHGFLPGCWGSGISGGFVWILGQHSRVSVGFLSHSRTEHSRGAPSPGKHGIRLAGARAVLPQTHGWAHQNRTTLEDFSSDEG